VLTSANEYIARAEKCEREAEGLPEYLRSEFLETAKRWRQMAHSAPDLDFSATLQPIQPPE